MTSQPPTPKALEELLSEIDDDLKLELIKFWDSKPLVNGRIQIEMSDLQEFLAKALQAQDKQSREEEREEWIEKLRTRELLEAEKLTPTTNKQSKGDG